MPNAANPIASETCQSSLSPTNHQVSAADLEALSHLCLLPQQFRATHSTALALDTLFPYNLPHLAVQPMTGDRGDLVHLSPQFPSDAYPTARHCQHWKNSTNHWLTLSRCCGHLSVHKRTNGCLRV